MPARWQLSQQDVIRRFTAWWPTNGTTGQRRGWYRRVPQHLAASTLADEADAQGRARVFVFGSQETQAGLLAGRATARLFSITGGGEFVARGERPEWLARVQPPPSGGKCARRQVGGAGRGRGRASPARADVRLRAPGRLITPSTAPRRSRRRRSSSFCGSWWRARRLGQGETLDLLAASLDATALLGYETGADSPLMEQMVLHLDRELEFTLEMLNKTVGAGRYTLALTAAHGAVRAPEPAARAQVAVNGEALARAIDRALAERLDPATAPHRARGEIRLPVPLPARRSAPRELHARSASPRVEPPSPCRRWRVSSPPMATARTTAPGSAASATASTSRARAT